MTLSDFQELYARHSHFEALNTWANSLEPNIKMTGLSGSSLSLAVATIFKKQQKNIFFVANDSDEAAYIYHDLRPVLSDNEAYFFPSSFKKSIRLAALDTANDILRTEVLNRLANNTAPCVVITCPDALIQKVVSREEIQKNTLKLAVNECVSQDFLVETLIEYGFQQVDFVYEAGQFSVRGSIVDIFSFSSEMPYRCDFFGDEIDSIRTFDIETQLSQERKKEIEIVPDLQQKFKGKQVPMLDYLPETTFISFTNAAFVKEKMNALYDELLIKVNENQIVADLSKTHITGNEFFSLLPKSEKAKKSKIIEFSEQSFFKAKNEVDFRTSPQPIFHKNFDLVAENLKTKIAEGYKIYIFSDSTKQTDRIAAIFEDRSDNIAFQAVKGTFHEGFIDHDLSLVCYTDHQIFDRFHRYQLKTDRTRQGKALITLKELNQLNIGDYVVHIDHGIGTFGGLVRTPINGKMQEMIKLFYQNNDTIFVSIHNLHRISKYKGKDGEPPKINKLGSGVWERLKERTKAKVKDIARDLIKLYAARKSEQGFAFSPDSYLQHELEASFIYEDTPDQTKSTADVKRDMESSEPMDRLVCGDVGFGKTEVAMRAAFKAATDGKQTAVLVPTTVLALQHYKSFKERFDNFPITVEYLSRARTAKETTEALERLENGKIDIIIGTHKLVGKSVKFKDLGLLVIDEEQKFGVAVKEKLKSLKLNVDTLTMTATPIPRTLQFSLLGARDLSIINTPPPNRYPIQTEIHTFDEDLIKEAILLEMSRNGQVFFVNNRIQSIYAIQAMVKKLVPQARVAVGHGQMPAETLEETIVDFINYEYDVLVCTTIVESGVDIPNVNTIIINSAHKFGLSDLHQLRGRVGRSNRKAYCYLIAPELSLLTADARRRLQALETFAELGSGFNIAMQDLDIRGAGNMLGAEQSGFIADLGYETYQKILNEAMLELKEEENIANTEVENKKLTPHTSPVTIYLTDCQIDTDLELLFPNEYVENVSERIALYRELDNIDNEQQLKDFIYRLEDRFGKMPEKSQSLIESVRLRWFSMRYGIEKLFLKNERMTTYLVANNNSPFYQSENFGKMLQYITAHPRHCQIREQNGKRSIVFTEIKTIEQALAVLREIEAITNC